MAARLTGRHSVAIARSVHPEYREVLATYAHHQGMPLAVVPFTDNARLDLDQLEKAITADTACVLIQSPNFFGTIEDVDAIAEIAHGRGAICLCLEKHIRIPYGYGISVVAGDRQPAGRGQKS